MERIITIGKESRQKLMTGIDTLANAVRVTLGPKGRNVVIQTLYGPPHVTKDGVTVAKEIELADPVENMGANMIREVSSRTADLAGDGTTTATVLAQQMIRQGSKLVDVQGVNSVEVKRGMHKALADVVEKIGKLSDPIKGNKEKMRQVATISANNEPEIGDIIVEALSIVGEDGVVTVEESTGMRTYVEEVKGTQFKRGYVSPYFVNKPERMIVEYEKCMILFYDGVLRDMQPLVPIVETCVKINRPLLIIADEVEGEALTFLVLNKTRKNLQLVAVKSPSFGDNRKDLMQDMTVLTDGQYISNITGISLDAAGIEHLGQAEKVIVTKDSTTIIQGKGDKDDVEMRVNQLKQESEATDNPHIKAQYQERVAKLVGKVAIIHVGAISEVEMKEKKDRVDDALHATRAAVEEGVVEGGGFALLGIADELIHNLKGDQAKGYELVREALYIPAIQIADNAGYRPEQFIKDLQATEGGLGYNSLTDTFEDLFEAGILDPAKVTRVAVENAVSVASMVLTTECTINFEPKSLEREKDRINSMSMGY